MLADFVGVIAFGAVFPIVVVVMMMVVVIVGPGVAVPVSAFFTTVVVGVGVIMMTGAQVQNPVGDVAAKPARENDTSGGAQPER